MIDSNIYEGEFRDDKYHGVGKISYARENIVFHGIFNNGFSSKIGKLEPNNGSFSYVGELEDLKKHGCGIYIDNRTNRRYEGEFEDDIAMGKGRIIFENGDVYTGETDKMQRQGAGRMEYKNEEGKSFIG